MARDPSFPPPLSELAQSGIRVAAAPAGGMGMALDQNGRVPAGVLFIGTQALRIDCGRSTTHFPGTAVSDATVISHGLGVVPKAILLTGEDSGGSVIVGAIAALTAADFTCRFRDVQGAARGP